jgi:mevalonate kinase
MSQYTDGDYIVTDYGNGTVIRELRFTVTAHSVPQTVTRRQAKQALLINGKLSLVQPAIDAIADPSQKAMIQIEWDDSQEFERNRPSVIAIGTAIGLSSSQLDELFVLAATL